MNQSSTEPQETEEEFDTVPEDVLDRESVEDEGLVDQEEMYAQAEHMDTNDGFTILGPDEDIVCPDPTTDLKGMKSGETLVVIKKRDGIGNACLQRCVVIAIVDQQGKRHDTYFPLYPVRQDVLFKEYPELVDPTTDEGITQILPLLIGNSLSGSYWVDPFHTIGFDEIREALVLANPGSMGKDGEELGTIVKQHRLYHINVVQNALAFVNRDDVDHGLYKDLSLAFRALTS